MMGKLNMEDKLTKKQILILIILFSIPMIPSCIVSGYNTIKDLFLNGFPVVYNVFSKVKIKESGFFKYITIAETYTGKAYKNDPVIIVGFTDLGLQQEYLHIPKKIKDHPVTDIGYKNGEYVANYYEYPVDIDGNIKKIYVYDNIEKTYSFTGLNTEYYQCDYNKKLFYQDGFPSDEMIKMKNFKHYYIYRDLYDKYSNWPENCSAGNVTFMNNYPNEESDSYYSLDYVNESEMINVPPEPICANYIFTGWYTEQECINKWDFSNIPIISQDEEFKLYAGWLRK